MKIDIFEDMKDCIGCMMFLTCPTTNVRCGKKSNDSYRLIIPKNS